VDALILHGRVAHVRYGPPSVALTDDGAMTHKAECEPDHVFLATTTELTNAWHYLHPKPVSPHPRPNAAWELRLTTRNWHRAVEDRRNFVLTRGWEVPKAGHQRDYVENVTWQGTYEWGELHHQGDVYDNYVLTLTLPAGGNTDKATGEHSELVVVYHRDTEHHAVSGARRQCAAAKRAKRLRRKHARALTAWQ